jgi:hypothetical protein
LSTWTTFAPNVGEFEALDPATFRILISWWRTNSRTSFAAFSIESIERLTRRFGLSFVLQRLRVSALPGSASIEPQMKMIVPVRVLHVPGGPVSVVVA